jgi:hypothetical protein
VRTMSIPPFERKIEIADFDFFVRSRLAQAVVIWPEHVILDVFRCIGAPIAAEVKMAEQLEENFEDRPVGGSLSKEVRPRKSCRSHVLTRSKHH